MLLFTITFVFLSTEKLNSPLVYLIYCEICIYYIIYRVLLKHLCFVDMILQFSPLFYFTKMLLIPQKTALTAPELGTFIAMCCK